MQYYEVTDSHIASLDKYFTSTDILKYQSYLDNLLKGSNPPPDFFENHGQYSESLMSEITFYR